MNTAIHPPLDPAEFAARAGEVSSLLKALGNQRRLMIMCKLAEHGEVNVGDLAGDVGLSQSALSQHLAKLRTEGLVTSRKDAQTAYYRIADPRCETLLATLYQLYCS